jgi:putative ABC transport system permease protein
MRIRYAWRNLLIARGRFLISLFGISFATFLMAMQGSLLYGFTLASSRIVDAIDADIWIVGPGTAAFEYAASVEERLAWLVPGVPGIAAAGRGLSGWAELQKENGDRFAVIAVGVDREFLGRIPDVRSSLSPPAAYDGVAAIDKSELRAVGISTLPITMEVGGRRADITTETQGFASFLGTPFLFADFHDVRRFTSRDPSVVTFIVARVTDGSDPRTVRDSLRARFPNVDIWTKQEFSLRCRIYWLIQTGAGGALVIATLLGFFIGVSLVAQTIYSQTAESVEEYATMKAMGASNWYVISIVLAQSLMCGAIGGIIGLSLVGPFAVFAREIVKWVVVPSWMYALVGTAVALLCVIAAMIGSRPAVSVEPARVFRA